MLIVVVGLCWPTFRNILERHHWFLLKMLLQFSLAFIESITPIPLYFTVVFIGAGVVAAMPRMHLTDALTLLVFSNNVVLCHPRVVVTFYPESARASPLMMVRKGQRLV